MLFSVLFEHSVVTDCFIHKGDGDTEVESVHRLYNEIQSLKHLTLLKNVCVCSVVIFIFIVILYFHPSVSQTRQHLLILMLYQTCMNFFLQLGTKVDILQDVQADL